MSRLALTPLFCLALAATALADEPAAETIPGRWSPEKANAWYDAQPWRIGCNYLPATAINQLDMFQAETFDPETIDTELDWARDLGFNTLRVYLHDLLWADDAEGLYARMDEFLGICDRHGIQVLFVFFDDCHYDNPTLGEQPPTLAGIHNSGWRKSPGGAVVARYHDGESSEAEVARLKGYVAGTIGRFQDDDRIVAWELWNEPGRTSAKTESATLLLDAYRWAREVDPSQPICSTAEGSVGQIFIDIARANSDVHSFHCYSDKAMPGVAAEYAALPRPAICTEYMARPRSYFKNSLPILKKYRIGAINWGFVSGESGTVWPWSSRGGKDIPAMRRDPSTHVPPGGPYPEPEEWFHDIYRTDGTPYSTEEVDFLREMTGVGDSAG